MVGMMGEQTALLGQARAIDAVTLRDKNEEFCNKNMLMWSSVPDGKYLLSQSDADFLKGKRMNVPLIVGGTVGESMGVMGANSMPPAFNTGITVEWLRLILWTICPSSMSGGALR